MKKKLLSLMLASTMALSVCGGIAACGGGADGGSVGAVDHSWADDLPTITNVNDPISATDTTAVPACTIKVWCPSGGPTEAYQELADEFTSDAYRNGKYKNVTIEFDAVAEGDVRTKLATDPQTGADVFFFETGQIVDLVEKNILQDLGGEYSAAIKQRDSESFSTPIVYDGHAMAFPTASDNGYFLWYDSEFYTNENEVKTLDALVSKAKAANKHILFDYGNGWYMPSFFFGAGLKMDFGADGKTYVTDIDSEKGQKVAKAVYNYLAPANNNNCIIKPSSDINSEIPNGMIAGSLVAGVCGTWIDAGGTTQITPELMESNDTSKITQDMKDYVNAHGDKNDDGTWKVNGDGKILDKEAKDKDGNPAPVAAPVAAMPTKAKCAKLPTYTLDGEQKQMGSFMGGKYCGVNALRPNRAVASALANYFTNQNGQSKRFAKSSAGPTNKTVAASDDVAGNKTLSALSAQNAAGGYAQLNQSSGFWDGWAAFGNDIAAGTTKEGGLNKALTDLATLISK